MDGNRLADMLYRRNLLDDSGTTDEYLEIINDYMLPVSSVARVLNMASGIKEKRPDFNHYEFIVYGLISSGKRKPNERT